jgi:hypothetical protein
MRVWVKRELRDQMGQHVWVRSRVLCATSGGYSPVGLCFLQIATNCLSPLRCTWAINRLRAVVAVVSRGDLKYQIRDQQDKHIMLSSVFDLQRIWVAFLLGRRAERRRQLLRLRRRWECRIAINFNEIWWGVCEVDSSGSRLVGGYRWRTLFNIVVKKQ